MNVLSLKFECLVQIKFSKKALSQAPLEETSSEASFLLNAVLRCSSSLQQNMLFHTTVDREIFTLKIIHFKKFCAVKFLQFCQSSKFF